MKRIKRSIFLITLFWISIIYFNAIQPIYGANPINKFRFDVLEYHNSDFEDSIHASISITYFDTQGDPHAVFPEVIMVTIANTNNIPIMTRDTNPDEIFITNSIQSGKNVINIQCNLEEVNQNAQLIISFQSNSFTNNYEIENYNPNQVTVEYLDSTEYDIFTFKIQLTYIDPNDNPNSIDKSTLIKIVGIIVLFLGIGVVCSIQIKKSKLKKKIKKPGQNKDSKSFSANEPKQKTTSKSKKENIPEIDLLSKNEIETTEKLDITQEEMEEIPPIDTPSKVVEVSTVVSKEESLENPTFDDFLKDDNVSKKIEQIKAKQLHIEDPNIGNLDIDKDTDINELDFPEE